LELNIMSI